MTAVCSRVTVWVGRNLPVPLPLTTPVSAAHTAASLLDTSIKAALAPGLGFPAIS